MVFAGVRVLTDSGARPSELKYVHSASVVHRDLTAAEATALSPPLRKLLYQARSGRFIGSGDAGHEDGATSSRVRRPAAVACCRSRKEWWFRNVHAGNAIALGCEGFLMKMSKDGRDVLVGSDDESWCGDAAVGKESRGMPQSPQMRAAAGISRGPGPGGCRRRSATQAPERREGWLRLEQDELEELFPRWRLPLVCGGYPSTAVVRASSTRAHVASAGVPAR
ncbi:hypothetical protein B0H17DRAFT_1136435 [Mycena rosella]|uniref:Uncharacterized protein n=1 Tax=Mycena rosella TaxID=1033263 RepID=A0AAD7GGK3_MYCRO|nr:hypothetical protein B0H17DRAFT_1136435 [Mycena rosella]